MPGRGICVLGGTGFIGRALVARLAADGHSVKVLTRDPTGNRDLLVLPTVRLVRADVHDAGELEREFAGCDVVVNLVGILNERRPGRGSGAEFRRVHAELPMKVVRACRASGVRRYLHMSGLKADAKRGPSHYLRSKGEAEEFIRRECAHGSPEFVIFQPSVVFGPADEFVNKFAALLAIVPGVMPLACAGARFAPVYVVDVAEAFARSVDNRAAAGRTFQLCGPEVVTLGDDRPRHRGGARAATLDSSAARRRVEGPGRDHGLRPGQAVLHRQLPLGHAGLDLRLRRTRGTRHRADLDAGRRARLSQGEFRARVKPTSDRRDLCARPAGR